jgi:hypothetical protein
LKQSEYEADSSSSGAEVVSVSLLPLSAAVRLLGVLQMQKHSFAVPQDSSIKK